MKCRVVLHGTATTEVLVEASSTEEANRLAKERAPRVKGVRSWTPVMTSNLDIKNGIK